MSPRDWAPQPNPCFHYNRWTPTWLRYLLSSSKVFQLFNSLPSCLTQRIVPRGYLQTSHQNLRVSQDHQWFRSIFLVHHQTSGTILWRDTLWELESRLVAHEEKLVIESWQVLWTEQLQSSWCAEQAQEPIVHLEILHLELLVPVSLEIIRSLSNDDGDVNENGKKAIGLHWQNNNFARASRFLVHFLPVAARLRRKLPNFTFFSITWAYDDESLLLFSNLDIFLKKSTPGEFIDCKVTF